MFMASGPRGGADKNLSAFVLSAWSGILAYHVTRTKGTHSVGSALGIRFRQ
jgi:hypothetical protein